MNTSLATISNIGYQAIVAVPQTRFSFSFPTVVFYRNNHLLASPILVPVLTCLTCGPQGEEGDMAPTSLRWG